MTIAFSLIFACRITGNSNSRLEDTLNSICEKLSAKRQVELIVKFDDDDVKAQSAIDLLSTYNNRLSIKTLVGPRGAGYTDLHKMYYDMFLQIDKNSKAVWTITDDVVLFYVGEGGWDEYVVDKLNQQENPIFTFHIFDQIRDYHLRTPLGTVESPDGFPIWSREWVVTQGSLGPIYSVDGWTALVERYLLIHYGLECRVHLEKLSLHRHIVESDGPGYERYDVLRRKVIDYLISDTASHMVAATARNLYYAYFSYSNSRGGGIRQERLTVVCVKLLWFRLHRMWRLWRSERAPLISFVVVLMTYMF